MKNGLMRAFKIIEVQLGDASERYFDEMLCHARDSGRLPKWIIQWYRSDKWSKDDRRGVDFGITTDKGVIKINVKSSRFYARRFACRHNHHHILPFVVHISESEEDTLSRFLTFISGEYRRL